MGGEGGISVYSEAVGAAEGVTQEGQALVCNLAAHMACLWRMDGQKRVEVGRQKAVMVTSQVNWKEGKEVGGGIPRFAQF